MPSPLIRYPETSVILPVQFCGTVQYYATMAMYGRAVVDLGMRYDKRFKSAHRCAIADTQGRLDITVPVCKPSFLPAPPAWDSVQISAHDQWWTTMAITLESAYGRTPFFEYYFYDKILPHLCYKPNFSVGEMDRDMDKAIREILHLETRTLYSCSGKPVAVDELGNIADFRRSPLPKLKDVPYYQIRAQKLGFLPSLSVLDLIFNMGPEAQEILLEMQMERD